MDYGTQIFRINTDSFFVFKICAICDICVLFPHPLHFALALVVVGFALYFWDGAEACPERSLRRI